MRAARALAVGIAEEVKVARGLALDVKAKLEAMPRARHKRALSALARAPVVVSFNAVAPSLRVASGSAVRTKPAWKPAKVTREPGRERTS